MGKGGGQVPLPENVVSVLCISSYSKTLSRPIIYALFSQFLVLPPDHHRGSTPGLRWGTIVSRPPNLPTPGKNPAGAYVSHCCGSS